MEDSGILDINNPINIAVFDLVYEKPIQKDLNDSVSNHNNHCVRTDHNKTPLQL